MKTEFSEKKVRNAWYKLRIQKISQLWVKMSQLPNLFIHLLNLVAESIKKGKKH